MPEGYHVALAVVGGWLVWRQLVLEPAKRSKSPWGPRWLAKLASGALFKFGTWWLDFSTNGEESVKYGTWDEGKQFVMAWHPHGAFTIAALYFVSNMWARKWPGGPDSPHRFVCVAPLLLNIPGLAEFLLLCNARSQDSKTFSSLLGTGSIVAVQPGGIKEQVATDANRETVLFGRNLGFIRLALKHGTPILPVYAFGENQLYPTSGFVRKLNALFGTNLVVHGLGNIPVTPLLPNPLLLPKAGSGLHIRWGQPVDVGPPDESPSEEKVLLVFEHYVGALRQLFDAHKRTCLPREVADRGLEVLWRGQQIIGAIPPGHPAHGLDRALIRWGSQSRL